MAYVPAHEDLAHTVLRIDAHRQPVYKAVMCLAVHPLALETRTGAYGE